MVKYMKGRGRGRVEAARLGNGVEGRWKVGVDEKGVIGEGVSVRASGGVRPLMSRKCASRVIYLLSQPSPKGASRLHLSFSFFYVYKF